jgi:hypothetical protein
MKLSVRLRGKQSARDKEGCLFSVASAFTCPLKENILSPVNSMLQSRGVDWALNLPAKSLSFE